MLSRPPQTQNAAQLTGGAYQTIFLLHNLDSNQEPIG
jgi:hypothetical protein